MRYQLLQFIAFLFISISAIAQQNGSFETVTGTNSGDAFRLGEVPHWTRSHGSPSLVTGAPTQGARAAWMWSAAGYGEGILQDYAFEAGETYEVKFWVRTNNAEGVFFIKAANGVTYRVPNIRDRIPEASSEQIIFTDELDYYIWKQFTIKFTPNADYSQLWIYPFLATGGPDTQAELTIDGIQIGKKSCGFTDKEVNNHSFEQVTGSQFDNAFALGEVTGWQQSHGTPEIRSNASTGNYAAWMSANNRFTEGIVRRVSFVKGRQYNITFWVKGNTTHSAQLFIKAAYGVPSQTFPLIPFVGGSQTIYNGQLNFTDWTQQTVSFTADRNYSQLWIYPTMGHSTTLEVGVDEISMEEYVCTYSRTTSQEVVIGNGQPVMEAEVYPNPASEKIKISLPASTKQVAVNLIQVSTGQSVANFTMNRSQSEWGIPAKVKNGAYLMVITDLSNKATKTIRVIVNRR